MKGSSISKYFYSKAWAIESGYLEIMEAALASYKAGEIIETKEADKNLEFPIIDGVAVLSYSGSFHKKLSGLNAMSGGISGAQMISDLQVAAADDSIKSIVLSLDTPGGTVDGVVEVAAAIKDAKAFKPIVTYADGLMASAGVWIGATADAIVAGETAQVGSIGVIMVHQEGARAEESAGIKSTVLSAGKYKGDGNRHEPLSDQARDNLQASLDYYYSMFVDHVADCRGMSIADTLANIAEGRMFIGAQAVGAGLVDKIGNLETAIQLSLSLGGYNVKQELKEALSSMDSKELISCLADANLPDDVKSAIDASLVEEKEITMKQSDYDGLMSQITEAVTTIEDLTSKLTEADAAVIAMTAELKELKADSSVAEARASIVAQFTKVDYEASDELLDSLMAMDDPSIIIESTIALHTAKVNLADTLTGASGLSDSSDPVVPKTIDEAVAAMRVNNPEANIDTLINLASTTYPELFNY